MLHATYKPSWPLAQFVDHLWYVKNNQQGAGPAVLLPDGCQDLIINLGPPQFLVRCHGVSQRVAFQRGWLAGVQSRAIHIETTVDYEAVGVRFRLGSALPVVAIPSDLTTGLVFELEDVWGSFAREIWHQVAEAERLEAKFGLLERALTRRLKGVLDKRVEYMIQRLREPMPPAVSEIADVLGMSHKHMIRLARKSCGLSPKALQRLFRFRRAVDLMTHPSRAAFSDIALDAGYFDHAHLDREFKRFAEMSPRSFLEQSHVHASPVAHD